ncbi:MAG TPA: PQQ-binding-like beta-propeller repeat protein [Casimicrobiaceae bacterium]|nr:PQQ-binding-like beta-propeller repeat protein [Casimicrobiaceae bacterium]
MSRLFISHSSRNDDWAIALRDWLMRNGWSAENDVFLDLDPERGIVAGERWARALEEAATRCEAVLYLVSEAWLASKWCWDEYQLAKELNKKLFALLIDDVPLARLPSGLTAQWQVVRLNGEPSERFLTVHPRTQQPSPVHIARNGLTSLKRGLEKAGIGAETFDLQPDANEPFGWRATYRGLEALEAEDAAVFFGRNADIVRGIDALRGLAAHKPPRLLVILGASGSGKSSFLRAGLWPRLARDDDQWLPLKAIRGSRGGAIEGGEGLLAALEDVHARFALRTTRATLREVIATPAQFVALLRALRMAAARRALLDQPLFPLPVLCLDQGEELFGADAGPESATLLTLARAAIDADEALLLVTIRSDAYGLMQGASALVGVDQVALPLGPVPQGEIGRIIREPTEVLRRKAGPQAPAFDAAVVEQLQKEVVGEADALPLLAFVLQRLMREYAGQTVIGIKDLQQTGGIAAAVERAAEAALADAGYGQDRVAQREVLRRLFIPRLARIDRESRVPRRRVAYQRDLPTDLTPLVRTLTDRRLLVTRLAQPAGRDEVGAATLEVAHEAMLRRWPTLADLLAEDRDALLMLDGVLAAANDWSKADVGHKQDFLAHRGSRLADTQALAMRGPDWAQEIAPAHAYLAACGERETVERSEREAEREVKEAAIAAAQKALASAQEAVAREQKALAAHSAAQLREARLQRRGRWTLAGMMVAVLLGLWLGGWQYKTNLRTRADLLAEQAETARRQAKLDRVETDLAAEQAETARRQTKLDRVQADLAANQTQLDQRLVDLIAEFAMTRISTGNDETALRLATYAEHRNLRLAENASPTSRAPWVFAKVVWDSRLRLLLSGHSADFSPDGNRIVIAADDKTARVWDTTTGKQILALSHDGAVYSAAFSPDGRLVVTGSDKTAHVWDAMTGKRIAALPHDRAVESVAFSPDGRLIATVSYNTDTITANNETARVWDAMTAKQVAAVPHNGAARSANFSPDGKRIITVNHDTAVIWDATTGRQITALPRDAPVQSAIFSFDGRHVFTVDDSNGARIWDLATHKTVMTFKSFGKGDNASYVNGDLSLDGKQVITVAYDSTAARIWDATTGKPIWTLQPEDGITFAAFSPERNRVVTLDNKLARIWDVRTGKQVAALPHDGSANFAAFSRDGKRVVTSPTKESGESRIWDAAAGRPTAILSHSRGVGFAVFDHEGKRVVTTDGTAVRLWDATTGKQTAALPHERYVYSAVFSPDGKRIFTESATTALIWDATTGKQVTALTHAGKLRSTNFRSDDKRIFSPDGKRIVTQYDKTALIWDATTGKQIAALMQDGTVQSAAFSPDGSRIVTASDNAALIWDALTNKQVATLPHQGTVRSAAFSPDGKRIVTESDNVVLIWDAVTNKQIATLPDQGSAVFSPDSKRIVTVNSRYAALRVWDLANDRPSLTLPHRGAVHSAIFSPDGNRIVTVTGDTAVIRETVTGNPIAIVREDVFADLASAAFSPDGERLLTRFELIETWQDPDVEYTARIWDAHFATMDIKGLLAEVCERRLRGRTALTSEEMELLGFADDTPAIDACALAP